MRQRYETFAVVVIAILSTSLASTPLAAQWFKYPTAAVPRNADGSVNMSGSVPRMADGKPDFSGIWTTAEPNRRRDGSSSSNTPAEDKPADPTAISGSRQMSNI